MIRVIFTYFNDCYVCLFATEKLQKMFSGFHGRYGLPAKLISLFPMFPPSLKVRRRYNFTPAPHPLTGAKPAVREVLLFLPSCFPLWHQKQRQSTLSIVSDPPAPFDFRWLTCPHRNLSNFPSISSGAHIPQTSHIP